MTHPETRQMKEDEEEYQRRLDAEEDRQREIDTEISFLRVDIAARNQHLEFVEEHVDDPAVTLANIIRQACLHKTPEEIRELGRWLKTRVDDHLRHVAEKIVDRRPK